MESSVAAPLSSSPFIKAFVEPIDAYYECVGAYTMKVIDPGADCHVNLQSMVVEPTKPQYVFTYSSDGVPLSNVDTKIDMPQLGAQLFRSLSLLHKNGFVFADVHASKIVVERTARFKLFGFNSVQPGKIWVRNMSTNAALDWYLYPPEFHKDPYQWCRFWALTPKLRCTVLSSKLRQQLVGNEKVNPYFSSKMYNHCTQERKNENPFESEVFMAVMVVDELYNCKMKQYYTRQEIRTNHRMINALYERFLDPGSLRDASSFSDFFVAADKDAAAKAAAVVEAAEGTDVERLKLAKVYNNIFQQLSRLTITTMNNVVEHVKGCETTSEYIQCLRLIDYLRHFTIQWSKDFRDVQDAFSAKSIPLEFTEHVQSIISDYDYYHGACTRFHKRFAEKIMTNGLDACDELVGAIIMQLTDPSGNYHALLTHYGINVGPASITLRYDNAGFDGSHLSGLTVTLHALAASVFQALHRLHSQGFVHGDIKPSNLCVDVGGNLRLINFSSVRLASCWIKLFSDRIEERKEHGLEYFPPEMQGHDRFDAWVERCLSSRELRGTQLVNNLIADFDYDDAKLRSSFRDKCLARNMYNPFNSEVFMAMLALDIIKTRNNLHNDLVEGMIRDFYENINNQTTYTALWALSKLSVKVDPYVHDDIHATLKNFTKMPDVQAVLSALKEVEASIISEDAQIRADMDGFIDELEIQMDSFHAEMSGDHKICRLYGGSKFRRRRSAKRSKSRRHRRSSSRRSAKKSKSRHRRHHGGSVPKPARSR